MKFKTQEKEKKFEENLETFSQKNPLLKDIILRLNNADICYGLFGGTQVWLTTASRETTDIDILVANKDFDKVRSLFLDSVYKEKEIGNFLYLPKHNIEFGSNVSPKVNEVKYLFLLTDPCSENRVKITFPDCELYFLNPTDTILLKAILQRGIEKGKHDLEDIEALVNCIEIDKDYLQKRFEECGCDERVMKCLSNFRLM